MGDQDHAFEALVIAGWVRWLSDRDVEAALAEALGPEATLSLLGPPKAKEVIDEAVSPAA